MDQGLIISLASRSCVRAETVCKQK